MGPTAKALLPGIMSGRDTLRRQRDREASYRRLKLQNEQQAKGWKEAMERVNKRGEDAMARLHDTQQWNQAHPKPETQKGINTPKELLDADEDFNRGLDQIRKFENDAEDRINKAAIQDESDPSGALAVAQAYWEGQRATLQERLDRRKAQIYTLSGNAAVAGAQGAGTSGGAGGAKKSTGPPSTTPSTLPSTTKPIIQHDKTTDAWQYSLDGGKTWKAGKPPGY
jgi:hypothetical protein